MNEIDEIEFLDFLYNYIYNNPENFNKIMLLSSKAMEYASKKERDRRAAWEVIAIGFFSLGNFSSHRKSDSIVQWAIELITSKMDEIIEDKGTSLNWENFRKSITFQQFLKKNKKTKGEGNE